MASHASEATGRRHLAVPPLLEQRAASTVRVRRGITRGPPSRPEKRDAALEPSPPALLLLPRAYVQDISCGTSTPVGNGW